MNDSAHPEMHNEPPPKDDRLSTGTFGHVQKRFRMDVICASGVGKDGAMMVHNSILLLCQKRRSNNWYIALFLIIISLHGVTTFNNYYRSLLPDDVVSIEDSSTTNCNNCSKSSTSNEEHDQEPIPSFTPQRWSDVKLLIYMTTHLPDSHTAFLPCWKDAVERLTIFKYADLMIYTSTIPTREQLEFLPFSNVVIKHYSNPGYHEGAVQAMVDPFLDNVTSWFDDYDWVIRVNMDVLIREDTWLIQTMLNPNIDLIVMDCWAHGSPVHFQTDFFAFRPSAVDRELLLQTDRGHAETHFTAAFRHMYDAGRSTFIPGAKNEIEAHCRIAGVHSPVLHVHELANYCPYYYNVTKEGFY